MSSPTCGLRVASAVFGVICVAQLLRILMHVSIVIGGHWIGRKISAVAVVITGVLCIWLWLLSAKPAETTPAANPPA